MTDQPNLRDRAIDAVGQALGDAHYWLPVEGRPIAVDAVLALVGAEACCVCGSGPVTYRNYRDQPFCQLCADGRTPACTHCGGDGYDPEDPGDYDPAVHMHNPGTRQPCPECIQQGRPPRAVHSTPAGQAALDRIRASIAAHETKADEAHDADRHRVSNEHAAIAAGLRIAEAHILATRCTAEGDIECLTRWKKP